MTTNRRTFLAATAVGFAGATAGCQEIGGATETASRSVWPDGDIQAALDDIPAGGQVVVEPGEHVIDRQLSPPSNSRLTVRGTIRLADGLEPDGEVQPKIVKAEGISDFVLEGPGTLDGNRDNIPFSYKRHYHPGVHVIDCERVTIRDIEIKHVVAGASISMHDDENVVVRNVYSHDHAKPGAPCDGMFFRVENALIERNTVRNVTDTYYAMDDCQHVRLVDNFGGQTEEYPYPVAQCASCYANGEEWVGVIRNNQFHDPRNFNAAITSFAGSNNDTTVHIEENMITGAGSGGIFLHNNVSDSTVADNTIQQSSAFGIEVLGPGMTVSGNTITGPGDDGIVVWNDTTVSGNRIDDADGAGVRLGNQTTGATVTDNHVSGCAPNVRLQPAATQCLVANNVLAESPTYGVQAADSDENLFEGNLIQGSEDGAWQVTGNENSAFADNKPPYQGG